MTDANHEVIVRQKRMDDARLRPAAGDQSPRPKLKLNFDTRGTVSVPRVKRRSMLKVVK